MKTSIPRGHRRRKEGRRCGPHGQGGTQAPFTWQTPYASGSAGHYVESS
jgi:hypothetical protein